MHPTKLNHRLISRARLLFIASCIFLQACSVCHEGVLPPDIEAQVYDVNCRVVINHLDERGIQVTSVDFPSGQVCSNDAPAESLMILSCSATVETNEENYRTTYPSYTGTSSFEPVNASLVEGQTCQLSGFTDVGEGEVLSRTDMLTASGGAQLLNEATGKILGKNSLTNSLAVVVDSQVEVGAKFLAWQHASTKAHGDVRFDRFNCNENNECDVILRHISLEFDDFTIVRPTVFARDVPVKDVKLYSLKNYATRTDSNGYFEVDGIEAIISSLIDGEKVNLLSGRKIKIEGKFDHYLHDQSHAALTMSLVIKHQNDHFSVNSKTYFEVHKFPSKLATGKEKDLCLTGDAHSTYLEARVSDCSNSAWYQAWSFELKGRYLRIRQPHSNMCLNVKSDSQNYDGGIVSIVNCSDHYDQLWAIDQEYNVVNLHTQKCLDVGGNKLRPEDDLVTISTCNVKADGQNWAVRKPS